MTNPTEAPSRLVPGWLRVLVIDGWLDEAARVSDALRGHPELTIVEDADRFANVTGALSETRPDVAVLYLHPEDESNVDVCRQIRHASPDSRVLILASPLDEETLFAAVAAGASGYLPRTMEPARLQDAVVAIAHGGSVLEPLMATAVLERLRDTDSTHPADDAFATLSPQEERILEMIAEGMTNSEIASALSLSQKTIKNYASQIYAKLNVERRSQAARLATERRMLKQR